MGSCAAPSAKGDDKFITTDYLQQCHFRLRLSDNENPPGLTLSDNELAFIFFGSHSISFGSQ
ncbi:hypothetical protein, partial [Lelliottia amnigena]|uniref:hypothetical protein n=1 Tax=Lelliottia amnigena TaxID=61646 RepID=UPI0040577ADD